MMRLTVEGGPLAISLQSVGPLGRERRQATQSQKTSRLSTPPYESGGESLPALDLGGNRGHADQLTVSDAGGPDGARAAPDTGSLHGAGRRRAGRLGHPSVRSRGSGDGPARAPAGPRRAARSPPPGRTSEHALPRRQGRACRGDAGDRDPHRAACHRAGIPCGSATGRILGTAARSAAAGWPSPTAGRQRAAAGGARAFLRVRGGSSDAHGRPPAGRDSKRTGTPRMGCRSLAQPLPADLPLRRRRSRPVHRSRSP